MLKVILMVGLTFFSLNGFAKTPDGKPPSEESVCDPLKKGTPGLYGLCVSYCEARDIDDLLKGGRLRPAKAEKVARRSKAALEKYNRKKRAGDPDMPCLTSKDVCPCWSTDYTNARDWLDRGVQLSCVSVDQPNLSLSQLAGVNPSVEDYANVRAFALPQADGSMTSYCGRIDNRTGVNMFQSVGESEAQVCAGQVRSTCGTLGFDS